MLECGFMRSRCPASRDEIVEGYIPGCDKGTTVNKLLGERDI